MNLKTTIASATTCLLMAVSAQSRAIDHETPSTLAGASPMFMENKGRVVDLNHKQRSDIDFTLTSQGVNVFIGDGQIHYQWAKMNKPLSSLLKDGRYVEKTADDEIKTEIYRLDA